MKNTVKISARNKASILMVVTSLVNNGYSKNDVVKETCKRMVKMGMVENGGDFNAMLAVAISFYSFKKAQFDGKKPLDCLKEYACFKSMTEQKLNDYGAFGDTLETALRCSVKPEWSIQWNDLHVARQSKTDLTLRGVKCEIGHNGKTFSDTDINNPFADYYDMIIYGVFSDNEKHDIYTLLINGQYEKVFEAVQSMMYVFDKETFFRCMTEKAGRAPMYQYKPTAGCWQVIYNPSKYTAFLHMVENEKIPTLGEYLKK